MSNKIPIKYCSFVNQSGYGNAAQSYILALNKSDKYDIELEVFGGKPSKPAVSDKNYEIFAKMMSKQPNKDAIQIYHCIPTIQRRVKKLKRNIGFATYETFSPVENWISILNENDAIITPSLFNYKIFAHARIKKPIFYLPHCIDMELYNENVKPLKKYNKFTFLFMGAWKKRKGYPQLFEAWLKEFTEKDNVQLVIKTDKTRKAKEYFEKIKKQMGIHKGFAPILFENKIFDEKELPRFIKSANCLIACHIGEGFGLVGLQCMALKVPVIITNFAGCQDYANEKTAILLEPEGYVLHNDMDTIPQFKNKKWAFFSIKQIRNKMRYVLNNKNILQEKIDYANEYVTKNFNYNKIEELFREIIKTVYNDKI